MRKELEFLASRYSCRNYKEQKLKDSDLKELLDFARLSPSSLGLEPWKFLVIKDENKLKQIKTIANNQDHIEKCSHLIIIVSRLDFVEYFEEKLRKRKMSEEEIQKRLAYKSLLENMSFEEKLAYSREQAHIALTSLLYGAQVLNIATCTIGGFNKAKLDEYLKLDTNKQRSTIMLTLGLSADEKSGEKTRFDFDEVVEFL